MMSRSGVRWGAGVTAIVGLGLLIALAPVDAAKPPASPSPAACGAPLTRWGGASANGVNVELLRVERVGPPPAASPAATPAAGAAPTFFAELRIENRSGAPATIAIAEITLDLCDGTSLHATTDVSHTPLSDAPLPSGQTRTGWVAFAVGDGDVPVRLVVPITSPGLEGGRVEFPLVETGARTVPAGPSGTPAHGQQRGRRGCGRGDARGGDGAAGVPATGAAGAGE